MGRRGPRKQQVIAPVETENEDRVLDQKGTHLNFFPEGVFPSKSDFHRLGACQLCAARLSIHPHILESNGSEHVAVDSPDHDAIGAFSIHLTQAKFEHALLERIRLPDQEDRSADHKSTQQKHHDAPEFQKTSPNVKWIAVLSKKLGVAVPGGFNLYP